LTARYKRRNDLHPRLFEETVGSVFRGLGFEARVTAYTNDGGIDVVLDENSETTIGIQVKRSKRRISVEQIRSFTGALVLGGYTKGVFVTTSEFQSGAKRVAGLAQLRGTAIELMDAKRFYDALRITQRPVYRNRQQLVRQILKVRNLQKDLTNPSVQ